MSDLERIILTCNYSPWSRYSGGGQRSTHALGCALAQLGYETHVVYTKPRWEHIEATTTLNYHLHWADFVGLRSDGKNPLRALNALSVLRTVRHVLSQSTKPTAIHAQGEEGALLHRLTTPSTRFVQTPRYPKFPDPLGGKFGGRLWLRPKFTALGHAMRHADRICPTSQASADELIKLFKLSEDRIEVIPNGVAEAFVQCTRNARAKEGPLVFFGRLSETKGVSDLLDAWLRMERAPELWLGGVGPEEAALRAKLEEAGRAERVRWLGWCAPEQMAEYLCGARAAVLPSHEESFGNTMVEAMASGTPLITTRVGSIPEVVGGESHATLLSPGDPDAIVRALLNLQDRPDWFEARAERAQEFARRAYSWTNTAQRYASVYEQALQER